MKLSKLVKLGMGVELIAEESGCTINQVVDLLTGVCWSEEEAGEIKAIHQDEQDV